MARISAAWTVMMAAAALLSGAATRGTQAAQPVSEHYREVALRVLVKDRQGKPLADVPVRLTADLAGMARTVDGQSHWIVRGESRRVVTDAGGMATVRLAAALRGKVTLQATLSAGKRSLTPLFSKTVRTTAELPAPGNAPVTVVLPVFEEPDTWVEGFPVWLGRDGRLDRVVVVLEGFDLYNRYSATDNLRLISPATDRLRAAGVDILVVSFPDSHLAPDMLAPIAAKAIRAAATASARQVDVAGLSAGGIVARWALVEAENRGTPLPVRTLLCLDTPHRGAHLNPALQAMTLRYGMPEDKKALTSPAARTLLTGYPVEVRWKRRGLPGADRAVPVEWRVETREHRAFFERLRRLNDRNGYPKQCRVVGVANSSRAGASATGDLLYIWLPLTYSWTLRAAKEDQLPGSLLPPSYVNRFRVRKMLGIAGSYVRTAPTFLPCASALDAAPNEAPPFDAWYAREDNRPFLPHDNVDPGAAAFVVRELLRKEGTDAN